MICKVRHGGWMWGHELGTSTLGTLTHFFLQHLQEMFLDTFDPNQLLWAPAGCSRTLTQLSWSHRFDSLALCWWPVSCRAMSHRPSLRSRAFWFWSRLSVCITVLLCSSVPARLSASRAAEEHPHSTTLIGQLLPMALLWIHACLICTVQSTGGTFCMSLCFLTWSPISWVYHCISTWIQLQKNLQDSLQKHDDLHELRF